MIGSAVTPRPLRVAVPALAVLVLSTTLMLARVEPFVTWYYIFAWYPTLALLDAGGAARSGRYYLLSRPRFAFSLLFWSAILWYVFELINFRVQNWYYVFLPTDRGVRWLGITLSFMTVLPAIFLGARWLRTQDVAESVRWPGLRVTAGRLTGLFVAGLLFAGLTLAWPRYFYPLVWGALTLLLEPWNYRADPQRSLLGDLERGRPGRILRLLLAGLAIGLIWELYNIEARGKWIYTVPGLEGFKLFEMPVPGFLGFPVFALDCFVAYQSLILARVAIGNGRAAAPRRARTVLAIAAGVVFSIFVLSGMERWTIDSYTPRLSGLWSLDSADRAALAEAGYRNPFQLAEARVDDLAGLPGAAHSEVREWVASARLATLRGIGTENARLLWQAGIRSVEDLARADPGRLAEELRRSADRPRAGSPPRVRVWVRSARATLGGAGANEPADSPDPLEER